MTNESASPRWRRFGHWLADEIRSAGMTQKDAAQKSGLHEVQLSRIVNGTSGTKRETIPLLAEAIGLDLPEAYRQAGYAPDIEVDPVKEQQKQDIGNRLRVAMRERGITSRELAREVGQSESNVSHWLTGRNEIPSLSVTAICHILNIPADWLLSNIPNTPTPPERETHFGHQMAKDEVVRRFAEFLNQSITAPERQEEIPPRRTRRTPPDVPSSMYPALALAR